MLRKLELRAYAANLRRELEAIVESDRYAMLHLKELLPLIEKAESGKLKAALGSVPCGRDIHEKHAGTALEEAYSAFALAAQGISNQEIESLVEKARNHSSGG